MKDKRVNAEANENIQSAEELNGNAESPLALEPEENLYKKIEAIEKKLDEKTKQCNEFLDMLQRTTAEFDNFKKRTVKDKESLYAEAVSDLVSDFLPVIDSIERAIHACSVDSDINMLKEGIELVKRQFHDVLRNMEVEEINSLNESFNPQIHNAVMHVDDEAFGQNTIVEEFQKGYKYKDKVIRHSMVKVAN